MPTISIETPVFKGAWLRQCIDSVLHQSATNWTYSLVWDGGDAESRTVLEWLARQKHPRVFVYFEENRGIARARRFLTERSQADFILPLDDDDALPFHAVERFTAVASAKPWASIIRGQRKIIDPQGRVIDTPPWFPFEPRHYERGMVTDLTNQTQPYLLRRSAYERTSGWEGFEDFRFAGEDCDIYLKLEEQGPIELVDEVLYYYRVHGSRASLGLTDEGAYEMWRRLADKTIARIGLPLTRLNQKPPYRYGAVPRPALTAAMVDFVLHGEGSAASGQAGRAEAALGRAGIGADAIQRVEGSVAAIADAMARSARAVCCLVDVDVELDASTLEHVLETMHDEQADLAAPALVAGDGAALWAHPGFDATGRPRLQAGADDARPVRAVTPAAWLDARLAFVRREVVRAVGGLDTGYVEARMAVIDLSLRARQRQFTCLEIGRASAVWRGATLRSYREDDLSRLGAKWATYPQLLE